LSVFKESLGTESDYLDFAQVFYAGSANAISDTIIIETRPTSQGLQSGLGNANDYVPVQFGSVDTLVLPLSNGVDVVVQRKDAEVRILAPSIQLAGAVVQQLYRVNP